MTPEEIKEYNRIRMGKVLDSYTPDTLPTYNDCRTLLHNEQYRKKHGNYRPEGDGILDRDPTELERYIYEETPNNATAEIYFRERLADLLNWHRAAILTHLPLSREQADPSVLLEALEKINDPIAFLRKEAEAEGCKLNGHIALQLADDAHWLRDIADKALTTYKESKPSPSITREQAEKVWNDAIKTVLNEIAKTFSLPANQQKADKQSDRDVFKAIGETIRNFPIPPMPPTT